MEPARAGRGVPSTGRPGWARGGGGRAALAVGVAAWLVQPLYIAAELVAAGGSSAPYSPVDQTISDLGATTCTSVGYPYGPVELCSPWHPLLNGNLVVSGVLLVVGAVLLHGFLPRRRSTTASTVAWVVAGLSSVATGLVPVDHDLALHSLVASPSLLAVPIGLLLLAASLRRTIPWVAGTAAALGLASLAGAVVFVVTAASPELGGVWERLGFWPAYLCLPVVALVLHRRCTARPGDGPAPPADAARHGRRPSAGRYEGHP